MPSLTWTHSCKGDTSGKDNFQPKNLEVSGILQDGWHHCVPEAVKLNLNCISGDSSHPNMGGGGGGGGGGALRPTKRTKRPVENFPLNANNYLTEVVL